LALVVVGGVALASLPDSPERGAALLWTGIVTASLVPLARSFAGEADRGTMDILRALPVDRGALLLGKALSNGALVLASSVVLLGGYVLLLGADVAWVSLLPVLVLGAVGIALAGSALAAIASQAKAREAMLPVLLLPLLLPVLLSAIPASIHALRGEPWDHFAGELGLLAGYDAMLGAAGWFLFEYVEEA
jgi:heme exporter protein B